MKYVYLTIYKLGDIHGYLHDNICLKQFKYGFLSGRGDGIARSMQEIIKNPQFLSEAQHMEGSRYLCTPLMVVRIGIHCGALFPEDNFRIVSADVYRESSHIFECYLLGVCWWTQWL